jgi:hypothetical protein
MPTNASFSLHDSIDPLNYYRYCASLQLVSVADGIGDDSIITLLVGLPDLGAAGLCAKRRRSGILEVYLGVRLHRVRDNIIIIIIVMVTGNVATITAFAAIILITRIL